MSNVKAIMLAALMSIVPLVLMLFVIFGGYPL